MVEKDILMRHDQWVREMRIDFKEPECGGEEEGEICIPSTGGGSEERREGEKKVKGMRKGEKGGGEKQGRR